MSGTLVLLRMHPQLITPVTASLRSILKSLKEKRGHPMQFEIIMMLIPIWQSMFNNE